MGKRRPQQRCARNARTIEIWAADPSLKPYNSAGQKSEEIHRIPASSIELNFQLCVRRADLALGVREVVQSCIDPCALVADKHLSASDLERLSVCHRLRRGPDRACDQQLSVANVAIQHGVRQMAGLPSNSPRWHASLGGASRKASPQTVT